MPPRARARSRDQRRPTATTHLSPLDNGAYGLVVRWLQRHAEHVQAVGLRQGMDEALRSVSNSDARYCFRNCGYIV